MNIRSNEIHVWSTLDETIIDSYLLEQYNQLLSREEHYTKKGFRFEKDQHQYLVTRALVRVVLSKYINETSPDQWKFKKNEFGKPYVDNSQLSLPLRFNISHTKKLIVLAVTLDREIGIDVEYLTSNSTLTSIAKNKFSPFEAKHFFDLPPEKLTARFFELWTLKESYIKACGLGLSIPLDHFYFSFSQQGQISISFSPQINDQSKHWHFWQASPSNNHIISMALKDTSNNNVFTVSTNEITPLREIKAAAYPFKNERLFR